MSTGILEKNLCCISLSPPLINLPILQEVSSETPQIKSTLHSIIVKEDLFPRLTMFLDPESEDISPESIEGISPNSTVKVSQLLFVSAKCDGIGQCSAPEHNLHRWMC